MTNDLSVVQRDTRVRIPNTTKLETIINFLLRFSLQVVSVGFRVRLCTILGTPMYYKYTRCNIEPTC